MANQVLRAMCGIVGLTLGREVAGSAQTSEAESTPMLEAALGEAIVVQAAVSHSIFPAAYANACHASTTGTILLVEDEAFVRKVMAEVLATEGYRLILAGTAAEALDSYGHSVPHVDLLLTDMILPGISGRELAAKCQLLNPQIRVLLTSGYGEQLDRCESSGMTYLAKPFSTVALLEKVRLVLFSNSR